MKNDIKRISIIGGSGTGKTTLSNSLGKVLNIPVCHLDGFCYFENWEMRDKKERDNLILEKISEDRWIIDGTYNTTLETRLKRSDLIIYLDYSTFAQLKGVFKRFFKNHGKEKEEIPGCKERMVPDFFWFVVKWRKNKRPKTIQQLESVDKEKLLVFKNRKELNKWYQNEFNEKIIV